MINPKLFRESPELIQTSLYHRGISLDILHELITCDSQWLTAKQTLEQLQADRNRLVPKGKPTETQREQLSQLSNKIKALQGTVSKINDDRDALSLRIPNVLQTDVPVGNDESDNATIETVGTCPTFNFEPLSHDALGEKRGFFQSEQAAKISGARFAVFVGKGAALERAVASYMLDTHTKKFGYIEVSPPVIVHSTSLTGTGQLPKFSDDLYRIDDHHWLSPTAEVQLTNLHQGDILDVNQLPRKYTAFTPCFRKEAGSYGKDMKGLIRLHQFNKVELVQITHPDASNQQLDELLGHAKYMLESLELPYRVTELCSGDIGFASSKTIDLDVWFPSQNAYREISSCSNFLEFQARRSKIRYRDHDSSVRYVHTINGSGLAVGRTVAAIMENFQTKSGTIRVPCVLQPYLGEEEL